MYLEKQKGYKPSAISKVEIVVDKKMKGKHAVDIAITFVDDPGHIYYYSKDKEGDIYQSGATGEKHYDDN